MSLRPRIVQKQSRSRSSCLAVIVAQHSAESLTPFDSRVVFANGGGGLRQPVSEPLMISLPVIVGHILCDRVSKRYLIAVVTLIAERPRTKPSGPNSGTRLPPWVRDEKTSFWPGMKDTRCG